MIRQLKSKSFLFFFRDHLRSTLGSLAVEDHLLSILGIICGLGIIYGWGSFAVLYSCLVYVGSDVMLFIYGPQECFVLFCFFFFTKFQFKKRNCRMVSFYHLPVDSFSFDRIVCSLGEPFRKKQPGYIFLRMIFFLYYLNSLRNSSLDHLRFVCTI